MKFHIWYDGVIFQEPLTKTLAGGMRCPLLNCWSWFPNKLQEHYKLLFLPLLSPKDVEGKPPLWTHYVFQLQNPECPELELS